MTGVRETHALLKHIPYTDTQGDMVEFGLSTKSEYNNVTSAVLPISINIPIGEPVVPSPTSQAPQLAASSCEKGEHLNTWCP